MPFLIPVVGVAVTGGVTLGGMLANVALRLAGALVVAKLTQNMTPKAQTAAYAAKWGGINVSARGAATPRDLIYGRTRTGGTIVYMATSGAKNQYLHLVITLSSCRVKSIGAVYFGSKMAVDADGVVQPPWAVYRDTDEGITQAYFEYGEVNTVDIEKRLGDAGQSTMWKLNGAKPVDWTTDHRLQGVACVYLRLTYTPSGFPQGLPDISFDVEGCDEVVDPRTGATGYSTNPALCLAHFMAHPNFGFGAAIGAADGLNTAALIEAANICDESVAAGGGTEARYTLNGTVSLAQDPMTTTREMLSAMAGSVAEIAGQFHIHAGAYRLPVKSLGLGDARGALRITTRVSMADNFNAVRGKFISPENDWQPDDFPAYQSDVYLAEDNGERLWRDIELPFTNSAPMAQRLAKIELERARRQISLPFPAQLPAWSVPVGETVALTHALRGWTDKPFVVVRSNLQLDTADAPALTVDLTLQETSPLVYDWDASEEQIYAAAPRSDLPSAFDPPPAPGILSAVENLYSTRNGAGVKAQLDVAWSASSAMARHYRLRGRQVGGDWTEFGRTAGLSMVIYDVAPGNWEFQVSCVTAVGLSSDWSAAFGHVVLGLPAPPSNLQNVAIQSLGGLALIKWALPSDLDVLIGGNIVVRHSSSPTPVWESSAALDEAPGQSTNVITALMPGAYLIRARDSSGSYGPVSILRADGVQALPFAALSMLQEDAAFLGGHGGTFADGGALTLGGTDDLWAVPDLWASPDLWTGGSVAAQGVYDFAAGIDFGLVKTVRLRREVQFISVSLNDDLWAVPDLWASPDLWGSSSNETSVVVQIATTNDDPAVAPIWSDWARLDATEVTARGVKARAILSTTSPTVAPSVTILRIQSSEVI